MSYYPGTWLSASTTSTLINTVWPPPKPSKIDTIRELKAYVNFIEEVTKDEFEYLEEVIPMTVDLLTMLNKIKIKSKYINQLNRSRKIKKLFK